MWESLINCFEVGVILVGSAAGGSLALGIFVVTATTRLLALPLTYRLALKGRARRKVMDGMRDELAALKKKLEADPARLMQETRSLYRARGLTMVDRPSLMFGVIQAPLLIALFQAVRRVSSGSLLAAGSWPIALLASTLATTAIVAGHQSSSAVTTISFALLAAGSAAAFTLMFGSGFGIYSAAFQGVSTLQGVLVRRTERSLRRRLG
jgi:membrane protein insertase Oxa1/YidC/SpoIIIJ